MFNQMNDLDTNTTVDSGSVRNNLSTIPPPSFQVDRCPDDKQSRLDVKHSSAKHR